MAPALARRLGTRDAVALGLGSMLGAGVFAAFAPAARAAGTGLLVGLVLALGVAYCNAVSSAELAAEYPTSGGTYIYGRERLGPWPGFVAGWGFVAGKTASCAAMALTFAAYAAPGWERPVGVAAVVAVAAVNYRGVTRTARLALVLLALTLVALAVFVAASAGAPPVDPDLVRPAGILQSAGLLFFAFAGYARIATMGEEVRDPRRTIPRAIRLALAIAAVVYTAVGVGLLSTLGPARLAASAAPLADAVRAGGWDWAVPVVRAGAATASLGALLALVAGVGRTALAMARHRDLPGWLDAVHPRFQVPHRAEVAVAAVVVVLVCTVDLRGAIGFSSFGVLVYYLIANLSAWSLRRAVRPVAGAIGCAVLAATLPWLSVLCGLAMFGLGLAYRWAHSRSPRRGADNVPSRRGGR